MAKLPPGSERSLDDPFAEKRTWWRWLVVIAMVIIVAVWIRVDSKQRGHYFWQKKRTPEVVTEAPANTNVAVEAQPQAPVAPLAPGAPAQ